MNDNITVIEKNPVPVIESLDPQRLYTSFQKFVLDVFGDSLYLRDIVTGADNKVVGYNRKAGQFKDDDIFSLLVECCPSRPDGQVSAF
jgi:hypothetical protein